ncbi:hypothetical protein GCM10022291_20480 [Postechiella marina]|uniref:Lipoprotein n=1 Tax=Postechiella marina TaxID=943941 RepID=A0ABP8C9Z8_9FLAO
MRKLKQFALLLTTLCLVTFNSCSSSDDGPNKNSGEEYLTAKIENSGFEAAQSPVVIVGAQLANGILAVQGGDNNGNTFSLAIQNYAGVGVYKTGDNLTNGNLAQYLQINPLETWASNLATAAVGTLTAGTIEITLDDGEMVEGTFSFEGYNATTKSTKNITEGKFKALFD